MKMFNALLIISFTFFSSNSHAWPNDRRPQQEPFRANCEETLRTLEDSSGFKIKNKAVREKLVEALMNSPEMTLLYLMAVKGAMPSPSCQSQDLDNALSTALESVRLKQ